ncbi:hypothetical protein [Paenibacillus sp. BIHB 4019]|nr:hypothetical protein [Paenibacillus sp. BIHB 4019]
MNKTKEIQGKPAKKEKPVPHLIGRTFLNEFSLADYLREEIRRKLSKMGG